MRFPSHLAALLAVLAVVGCSADRSFPPDSWAVSPPPPYPVKDCTELPSSQFAEVSPLDFVRYAGQLEQSPAIPLTAEQANALAPTISAGPATSPYLLRALFLNHGTGGFSVCELANGVLVSHGSLGRHAVPMKRTALVAYLSRAPGSVYVSVSMAE